MQNIEQILKEMDLIIPDDKKESFKKVFHENYKTVEEFNKQKTKLENEIQTLETTKTTLENEKQQALDSLKGFEGLDKEKYENALKELNEMENKHQAEIQKITRKTEIDKFISKHNFINEATAEYYLNKIENALDDDNYKNKNMQDIFDSFIKSEDGEIKPNIFATEDKNPKLVNAIPPTGNVNSEITKEQFKKMNYKERLEVYKNNKNLYENLKTDN